jgi:hypothetical protein
MKKKSKEKGKNKTKDKEIKKSLDVFNLFLSTLMVFFVFSLFAKISKIVLLYLEGVSLNLMRPTLFLSIVLPNAITLSVFLIIICFFFTFLAL